MKKSILLAFTLIGAAASILWASYHPKTSSESVQHEEFSAYDLASIEKRHITKLKVSLPEDTYTVNVWIEEWKKGEKQPTVKMLATMGVAKSYDGTLLFAFPTKDNPDWYLALGGAATWGHLDSPLSQEGGFANFDDCPIHPDEDIFLGKMAFTDQNGSSVISPQKGPDPTSDLTFIYKARFCLGNTGNKPTWTNGRVSFTQW